MLREADTRGAVTSGQRPWVEGVTKAQAGLQDVVLFPDRPQLEHELRRAHCENMQLLLPLDLKDDMLEICV